MKINRPSVGAFFKFYYLRYYVLMVGTKLEAIKLFELANSVSHLKWERRFKKGITIHQLERGRYFERNLLNGIIFVIHKLIFLSAETQCICCTYPPILLYQSCFFSKRLWFLYLYVYQKTVMSILCYRLKGYYLPLILLAWIYSFSGGMQAQGRNTGLQEIMFRPH